MLFCLIVFAVIWGAYMFSVGPVTTTTWRSTQGNWRQTLAATVERTLSGTPVPAPEFLLGVWEVQKHNARGHQSYLFGHVGLFGWWYYFPVALAVKTTLPLLILSAISLGLWVAGRASHGMVYPLLGAIAVLVVSISSNINIGVRHVLAIYPFLALAAAGLWTFLCRPWSLRKRALGVIGIGLVVCHVAESVRAHPDYLAYFNQLARGREEEFLLDSNLDWGQDLARLQRYLQEKKITSLHLSYFGRADLRLLGPVDIRPLPPEARPTGWVAASKSHIAGLYRVSNLAWLKGYAPQAKIGKSILVYYFPDRAAVQPGRDVSAAQAGGDRP